MAKPQLLNVSLSRDGWRSHRVYLCPFQGTDGEATGSICVPFKGRMAKPQGPAAIITKAAKTPVSSSQPLNRGMDTMKCPCLRKDYQSTAFLRVPFKGWMANHSLYLCPFQGTDGEATGSCCYYHKSSQDPSLFEPAPK
jgi:hypothetical protein